MNNTSNVLEQITGIVGKKGVIADPADMAPYLADARHYEDSTCDLVVRPATTDQVAAVVKLCAAEGVAITPRGGGTGLVGGSVTHEGIVLSLDRMNSVRQVDALNHTLTVDAGCILADIQETAAEAGCLFPLSLGAEGSCQIGGNLSTNAGGVGVLRYGNVRDLVLGLEVVLPDGRIWDGMNALRKNNTGYDLKQLFVGAEGTLGIITGAVLKLFPKPQAKVTTLTAVDSADAVLQLFDKVRASLGDRLTAFELIPRLAMELCTAHIPGAVDPFDAPHSHYALIEVTSPRAGDDLRGELEEVLATAFEAELVSDAVFAESEAQTLDLWRLRETIPEAQTKEGASIKHDVSVPVSKSIEFITEANKRIEATLPGTRVCSFGHIGDGNIHYNLTQPKEIAPDAFMAKSGEFHRIVHDLVVELGGSISAEHGIGTFKRTELAHYSPEIDIELMRRIKLALDPHRIMNPGKIFDL